ncbi:MAG: hypothetical protein HY303_04595 [Candidatus Wallbacteria bacterium]|nr:hypothetical protein [Candidatus Wallbacteria bacterium]
MLPLRPLCFGVLALIAVFLLSGCDSAADRERLEKIKVREADEAPVAGAANAREQADIPAHQYDGGKASGGSMPAGHPAVVPVESHGPKVEGKAGEPTPVGSIREDAATTGEAAEAGSGKAGTEAGSGNAAGEAGSAGSNCTCSKDKPGCKCGHCSGVIGECHCSHGK